MVTAFFIFFGCTFPLRYYGILKESQIFLCVFLVSASTLINTLFCSLSSGKGGLCFWPLHTAPSPQWYEDPTAWSLLNYSYRCMLVASPGYFSSPPVRALLSCKYHQSLPPWREPEDGVLEGHSSADTDTAVLVAGKRLLAFHDLGIWTGRVREFAWLYMFWNEFCAGCHISLYIHCTVRFFFSRN